MVRYPGVQGTSVPRWLVAATALVLLATGCASPAAHAKGTESTTSTGGQRAKPRLEANPSVVGLVLSGAHSSLRSPARPSARPYGAKCHQLLDPGFSGKCVVGTAPDGTVAGVVERETAVGGRRNQERDLVWRRQGRQWRLALVRVFLAEGPPTMLWSDDLERDRFTKLVFVTPSARAGFGSELDVVEASGAVVLFRYLGQGFAVVPPQGGLVCYVPGWTEQSGPVNAYDQVLIGYSDGAWRVFSEQYVPVAAALAQHQGPFRDSEPSAVTPAS
ncbi:MAG TPA: hypothetical protein VED59_00275 [Acidimicrobiales bacterium]|nr:hypothetical protein [Acidimicrobiales bacterium]